MSLSETTLVSSYYKCHRITVVQKVGSPLFRKSFKYFFCICKCYPNQVATVCDAVVSRRVRIGASQGVWGESWAVLGLAWVVLRRSMALRISGGDITCARHPWPTLRLLAHSSIFQLPFTPPSPLPPLGPKASEASKKIIQERPSKAYSNEPSKNTRTTYS